MEHLILFGASEAQQQWHRIGTPERGELAYRFAEGPLELPEDTTLDEAFDRARTRLQTSPGLAIRVRPAARGVEMKVSLKTGKGLSLPGRALLVRLDGHHEWTKLTDHLRIELAGWECLVVPAVAGVETDLTAFVIGLDGLPADYRAAMLFTLLTPTLESRVARIELIEPLLRSLPPIGTTHSPRSGRASRHLIRDTLLLGAVITLLLGLGVLFYRVSGVEAALAEQRQELQAGFAALGVSPESLARATNSDTQNDALTAAPGPAIPPHTPAPAADEMLDGKLSRFFDGSQPQSDWLLLDAVTFQGASPALNEAAISQIKSVAEILKKHPKATAEISGHSDSQGSELLKQQISQDRATAIENELVRRGVDPKRLTTLPLSDLQPLSGEGASSARNRRVEVRFNR